MCGFKSRPWLCCRGIAAPAACGDTETNTMGAVLSADLPKLSQGPRDSWAARQATPNRIASKSEICGMSWPARRSGPLQCGGERTSRSKRGQPRSDADVMRPRLAGVIAKACGNRRIGLAKGHKARLRLDRRGEDRPKCAIFCEVLRDFFLFPFLSNLCERLRSEASSGRAYGGLLSK